VQLLTANEEVARGDLNAFPTSCGLPGMNFRKDGMKLRSDAGEP